LVADLSATCLRPAQNLVENLVLSKIDLMEFGLYCEFHKLLLLVSLLPVIDRAVASGDNAAGSGDEAVTSPTVSTSVLLVTELIRLTLKKLQAALEDNRINDDDLVAMAMAVDAGAVSSALQTTRSTAVTCLKTSSSLPINLQTSDVACSMINSSGFGAAEFQSALSSTDRPMIMVVSDRNQPDIVCSSEIAPVAKKVLTNVMIDVMM